MSTFLTWKKRVEVGEVEAGNMDRKGAYAVADPFPKNKIFACCRVVTSQVSALCRIDPPAGFDPWFDFYKPVREEASKC